MSHHKSPGWPSVALHRYWMYANRMRTHFERAMQTRPIHEKDQRQEAFWLMTDERGTFMSYWYGGLYVVIEGWKELKLSDPSIDLLLKSPNVRLLKKFRNGAFHFQKKYFDDRFTDFMRSADSVPWVRELSSAFGAYFLRMYKGDGPQV